MRSRKRSKRSTSRKSNRKSKRKLSNNCSKPRGFTMIAHCKAIGKMKRSGKKNKGKYIKSLKYRRKSSRKIK